MNKIITALKFVSTPCILSAGPHNSVYTGTDRQQNVIALTEWIQAKMFSTLCSMCDLSILLFSHLSQLANVQRRFLSVSVYYKYGTTISTGSSCFWSELWLASAWSQASRYLITFCVAFTAQTLEASV